MTSMVHSMMVGGRRMGVCKRSAGWQQWIGQQTVASSLLALVVRDKGSHEGNAQEPGSCLMLCVCAAVSSWCMRTSPCMLQTPRVPTYVYRSTHLHISYSRIILYAQDTSHDRWRCALPLGVGHSYSFIQHRLVWHSLFGYWDATFAIYLLELYCINL